jgi:hypothetical protein
LVFDEVEDGGGVGVGVVGGEFFADGVADFAFFDGVAAPVGFFGGADDVVDAGGEGFVLAEVVVEGAAGFAVHGGRVGGAGFGFGDFAGELDDGGEVGFVVDGFLFAELDEVVEEGGHAFVVFGVEGHLVDDDFADVVLDGFGHRGGIRRDAFREVGEGGVRRVRR